MYLKLGTQLPYLKLGTHTHPINIITQVYLGSAALTGFSIGSTTINSIYVGSTKVWG
jgi:hypothetical protein